MKKYTCKEIDIAYYKLARGRSNDILKDEEIIANSPGYSYNYAKYIIKGRFFLAEKKIINNKYDTYDPGWIKNKINFGEMYIELFLMNIIPFNILYL